MFNEFSTLMRVEFVQIMGIDGMDHAIRGRLGSAGTALRWLFERLAKSAMTAALFSWASCLVLPPPPSWERFAR
jgi:hypothetical protein